MISIEYTQENAILCCQKLGALLRLQFEKHHLTINDAQAKI
jgi:hypothetical protein